MWLCSLNFAIAIQARSDRWLLPIVACTDTVDYVGKETAPGSRCMRANLGRGARLPSQEVSGVDATEHHILG
jgi:hypothetical protein